MFVIEKDLNITNITKNIYFRQNNISKMPCFRPGLTRHDKLNLSDSAIMWEEANNASCVINTDYKILWVVNSENYIYKRMALNRAKEVNILSVLLINF